MLLIVNAFLLVLVLDRENKSALYDHRAREETISILAKGGITLDADAIPKRMTLTPMNVPTDHAAEKAQATALLGPDTTSASAGAYTGPGGSTVRFYSDGAFSFLATPGDCPLGGNTPAKAALESLNKLQFTGEVLSLLQEEEGNAIVVSVRLYWQDAPVFTPGDTTVTFQNDELHSIEGYRLTGTPVPEESGEPLSVSTILLQLLDHITANRIVCRSITQVTAGYTLTTTQGAQPKLTPTWHITTDTNPDGYYLDAMTGRVL